jgi:hypothetical protein
MLLSVQQNSAGFLWAGGFVRTGRPGFTASAPGCDDSDGNDGNDGNER